MIYHVINHMVNHMQPTATHCIHRPQAGVERLLRAGVMRYYMINDMRFTTLTTAGGRGAAAAGGLHVCAVCGAVWHRPLEAAHHAQGAHHRAAPAGLPGACLSDTIQARCVSFLTGMPYVAAAQQQLGLLDGALQMLVPRGKCMRRQLAETPPICFLRQVVFMTGSLLKTIIAKMLSSRFHKAAHFDKLQDALHKACCWQLIILCCKHSTTLQRCLL